MQSSLHRAGSDPGRDLRLLPRGLRGKVTHRTVRQSVTLNLIACRQSRHVLRMALVPFPPTPPDRFECWSPSQLPFADGATVVRRRS